MVNVNQIYSEKHQSYIGAYIDYLKRLVENRRRRRVKREAERIVTRREKNKKKA